MDLNQAKIILGENLKLNRNGALPQTPRFTAFSCRKRKQNKRNADLLPFSFNTT